MQPQIARYQNVQIQTGSPGEILVALYDALFRFLAVARHSLQNKKIGPGAEAISKAYAIVSEFYMTLDHTKYPELCANLERIYDFAMTRLTHANLKRDAKAVEDVIRVLTPVREAFIAVVKQEAAAAASAQAKAAAPAGR